MQRMLSSGMSEGKTSVRLRAQRALDALLSFPLKLLSTRPIFRAVARTCSGGPLSETAL